MKIFLPKVNLKPLWSKPLWIQATVAGAILIACLGIYIHNSKSARLAEEGAQDKLPAVSVEESMARDLKKVFRTFGTVLPWKEVILKPPAQSVVREIFHGVGDSVAENEIILKSNSEAQNIKTELDKVDFELKNLDFNVTMALAKKKFLSTKEVRQKELEHRANILRSKLMQIENAGVLRAPISGLVADMDFKVGDYIDNNTMASVRVVDVNHLKIPLYVPQKIVTALKKDMAVTVTREGLQDSVIAKISTIAPAVDSKTGSVYVELAILNPPKSLLPGMYVELEFGVDVAEGAITVPLAAITREGDQAFVYKLAPATDRGPASENDLREIGKVTKVPVQVGMQQGNYIQIKSGIEELDEIVVKGGSSLTDGTDVEVIR